MHQFKTGGLVLRQIPYSDKNRIIKIYTRELGLVSVMISVSSSKTSRSRMALLQPMQLIYLNGSRKPGSSFVYCSDISLLHQLADCQTHPVKRMQMLFLQEMLYRSLTEEHADPPMFDFISNALQWLNSAESSFGNFHLLFLCRLSRFLGFYPINNFNEEECRFFYLQDGVFKPQPGNPDLMMGPEESKAFSRLLNATFENDAVLKLGNSIRRTLLTKIVSFYSMHCPQMGQVHSLQVLAETLTDN